MLEDVVYWCRGASSNHQLKLPSLPDPNAARRIETTRLISRAMRIVLTPLRRRIGILTAR